ncbi:DUF4150 domain-containing protein [bacterium]|nr:DUF4150 domain-containing protein [bacterium]
MGKPTVSANGLTVITKGNKAKLQSTIPDICSIPGPNGKIPIPFMNTAKSEDLSGGTVTVQIEGQSVAVMGSVISKSSGDAAGVLGGIISGGTEGKATTIMFSPDVIMEMRPVIRKTDMAIMNDINTISLSGWDVADVSDATGKEWITFLTLNSKTQKPLNGINLKITLPDGSEGQFVSAPGGKIIVSDIDPGSCSVKLDDDNEDYVIGITQGCVISGLPTKSLHEILIDVAEKRPTSS